MKRCMYCGHENEDSLTSCSVCGNKLGNALLTQEPVTAEEAAAQESMLREMTATVRSRMHSMVRRRHQTARAPRTKQCIRRSRHLRDRSP